MSITSLLDPVLGPLMGGVPSPYNLLLFSFILTGIITLVYKFFTDQKLMKELKDELKALQNEMKELKEHPDKVMELQKKAFEKNMKYMMQSFKPTLITMVPILIVMGWLRDYYLALGDPKIWGMHWILVYIIFSILLSIALRKLLKIY